MTNYFYQLKINFYEFDTFVKNLTNNKTIIKNNIYIEGDIKNSFYIIELKTGKILEKIINNNKINSIDKNLNKD